MIIHECLLKRLSSFPSLSRHVLGSISSRSSGAHVTRRGTKNREGSRDRGDTVLTASPNGTTGQPDLDLNDTKGYFQRQQLYSSRLCPLDPCVRQVYLDVCLVFFFRLLFAHKAHSFPLVLTIQNYCILNLYKCVAYSHIFATVLRKTYVLVFIFFCEYNYPGKHITFPLVTLAEGYNYVMQ